MCCSDIAFIALTLLVGRQEGHPAWWGAGMVICQEQGAELHMAQLMQLPPTVPFSGTTQVSRYQKGKTNLDFTEARDSEWQWHPLGIYKSAPRSRQITMPTPTTQAGCPSCCPTNSVKALKGRINI